MRQARAWAVIAAGLGLVGLALGVGAPVPQGPPARPRPGLTAQQTKEAVKLAQGAMVELRKKTEGASTPGADVREYVVGVELLSSSEADSPAAEQVDGRRRGRSRQAQPQENAKRTTAKETRQRRDRRAGPRAIVTSYRYFDDITVFSTVDLETGRVVKVEAAQHLRTPLSEPSSTRPRRWPARRATR